MKTPSAYKPDILIIDDEQLIREILRESLEDSYSCTTAESAEQALSLLSEKNFDLVISDIKLGGISGIEMIPRVLESAPDTVVMMISGDQTIDSAIEAMRVGAFDYIKKPFDLEHVEIAVRRALNHHLLLKEKRQYENYLEQLIEQRTARINYLAYHDVLTDLPNRVLFEDRLSQTLVLSKKIGQTALLLLSLDRFREIENTLGHKPASLLLREVSARLKNRINESATLARFEGDEFAILLTGVKETQEIIETVFHINEAFNQPFLIEHTEIFVTASMGISLFPNDGENAQALLKNAGAALSRAKENGGNNYRFYTPEINARAVKRLTLKNNLRRALEREEFRVFYQPKVNVTTEKIVGMEALVRWQHAETGLISPADFIPLAEETGLIVPLGEWILKTACAQSKLWHDEGFSLSVSVNLSVRQLEQPDLAEKIVQIIRETGIDPDCLNLEITESAIMKNSEWAIKTLKQLRKIGVSISIDDFGVGYSSLAYLKRLPVDILKIDKSFIRDAVNNHSDAALVETIITMAHNLKLKVVAEGVETKEQLDFLQSLECDEWQGYLCSQPVAPADFKQLLASGDFSRTKSSFKKSDSEICENKFAALSLLSADLSGLKF